MNYPSSLEMLHSSAISQYDLQQLSDDEIDVIVTMESITEMNTIPSNMVLNHKPEQSCKEKPIPPYMIIQDANRNHHVFFNTTMDFSNPIIQTYFHMFMMSRASDETVILHLGGQFGSNGLMSLSVFLNAIMFTPATMQTICAGPCGIIESFMWLFGSKREITPYGALIFGGFEITTAVPKFKPQFDFIVERIKKLGLLTDKQLDKLVNDYREILIIHKDVDPDTGSSNLKEEPEEIKPPQPVKPPVTDDVDLEKDPDEETPEDTLRVTEESFKSIGI